MRRRALLFGAGGGRDGKRSGGRRGRWGGGGAGERARSSARCMRRLMLHAARAGPLVAGGGVRHLAPRHWQPSPAEQTLTQRGIQRTKYTRYRTRCVWLRSGAHAQALECGGASSLPDSAHACRAACMVH
eukprot:363433-Chlamydomonas_euryale.AAC.1